MQDKQAAAIAKLVRERRIEKNLTQQQLADLTGLSLRSVQRLEKAEGISRAYTLEMVGKHLQLNEEFGQVTVEPVEPNKTLPDTPPSMLRPNKKQKLILSISAALFITLIIIAYTFQSATFPETAFELVLLLAFTLVVYTAVLYLIWR